MRRYNFMIDEKVENRGRRAINLKRITIEEMQQPGWVSIKLLSLRCGYTVQAIYGWIKKGEIEARIYKEHIVVKDTITNKGIEY
jgi:hypothetical protein